MNRRLQQSIGIVIALIGGATCLGACSHQHQYSAAPISAQIVDAETGQPVAGVYVVADWQLMGGLEGGNNLGAVTVMETQTDETGRFRFPAWGPKEIITSSGVYSNARVRSRAPGLTLFKSGYEYAVMMNYTSDVPDPNNMHSEWDGKTIKLKPFHGNSDQYKNVERLSDNLTYNITPPVSCSAGKPCPAACQWQNIPNTILAIRREMKIFDTKGINNSGIYGRLISSDAMYQKLGCASPTAILGESK